MVRKTIWVAVAACASALLLSAPAGAQAPPTTYGPGPGAVIDDTEVQAGDVINVSGDCGEANEEVTVSLGGEVLATGTTDGEGMYSVPVELPEDLAEGTYTLEVECAGQVFTVTVEVAGTGTGPGDDDDDSGGSLSRTGTDLKAPIALGVGLVALGGVVLALASSRRRQSA
jgi:hypothetical protein